jgi:hypothetical protein
MAYPQKMILGFREKLKRLRRLRLAMVATLSLALLSLPCSPIAEALESHATHAGAAITPTHSAHSGTHHSNPDESNCCTDCSVWLTARFYDGNAAIITHNWSRGDLLSVALTHAPSITDNLARDRRLTGPPSLAFVDGTSLFAKTQR